MTATDLATLLEQVRGCRVCEAHLPAGPRPIIQLGAAARLVIIGQAPGRRVHESGVPWDDPSGARLREWLGLSPEVFYDPEQVALMPMGLCYPGQGASGDNPPRRECAPLWHDRLLAHLTDDPLKIIIGGHAQRRYIPGPRASLTETVSRWRELLPEIVVLPHPSPRNQAWPMRHPWFEAEMLPEVRARIQQALRRE